MNTNNQQHDSEKERAERELIFKRFDANGDGKISLSELSDALRALGSVSDDEIRAMLSDIDSDKDGDIGFAEFMAFSKKSAGGQPG